MYRTPETCPFLPCQLTVEFSRNDRNPHAKFVRFILFEQDWGFPRETGTQIIRSVRDIAQFEDLRMTSTPRRMKEWLRKFIRESPGEVLESVSFRGDITDHGRGDEEVQVTVRNVRLTDHTLAIAEFALRHMVTEFINREVPDAS